MASGLALLAFMPESWKQRYAESQPLGTFEGNTPKNASELMRLFEKVAQDKFSVTENAVNSGVTAVGVPVFGRDGLVLLSLGCSAPSMRMPPEKIEEVKNLLFKIKAELEQKIKGSGEYSE